MGRLPLVVAAGAAAALAGCGGSGSKTFSASQYPITFKYSGKLRPTGDVKTTLNAGSNATDQRALALDGKNGLLLSTYRLHVAVDDKNLPQAKTEIDGAIKQVQGGAAPTGKIRSLGGLPAIEYASMAVTPPKNGASRVAFVFSGRTEIELNCQSTPDRRAEIGRYCDQMLATVKRR